MAKNIMGSVLLIGIILGLSFTYAEGQELAYIVITPHNPTMQVGESVVFTAQGYDTKWKYHCGSQ